MNARKAVFIVGVPMLLAAGGGLVAPPQFTVGTCNSQFADEKLRVCYGTGIATTGPGTGTAIFGEATNNIAIFGSSGSSPGVQGISNAGTGAVGESIEGTGLGAVVKATSSGDIFKGWVRDGSNLVLKARIDKDGNYVQVSSRRAKENIEPITEPLDKIGRLQGVEFSWTPEYGGGRSLGFIAEDVAQVLPQLVISDAEGTGLSYAPIVAVAIEGIKRQQEQIAEMRAENVALRDEVAALSAQVAELTTRLSGKN